MLLLKSLMKAFAIAGNVYQNSLANKAFACCTILAILGTRSQKQYLVGSKMSTKDSSVKIMAWAGIISLRLNYIRPVNTSILLASIMGHK